MDPASILKIITNSTWMVTKLFGTDPVEFGQSHYYVDVKEDTKPGVLLQLTVRVLATDSTVTFGIRRGNKNGHFAVDSASGQLKLVRQLDYESQQQHEMVVFAEVSNSLSEAVVVVRVQDANDHAPYFPRSYYETQITEEDDRNLPKIVLRVAAFDGDLGSLGVLTYSLTGEEITVNGPKAWFDVDPETGDLRVLVPLNRDPPDGRSKWRLKVSASDGELVAHTSVLVNLKDVNDNPPYFPQPYIRATISENTQPGALVAILQATDNDDPEEGKNARLSYSLEKNVVDEDSGETLFQVDYDTGQVSTAHCCLDREKTPSYTLQIVATDGGGLKGTGTVEVLLSDVNDVPPRFSRTSWSIEMPENSPVGVALASFPVMDGDLLNNFTYRVVPGSGEGWEYFEVTAQTGGAELSPLHLLDYENPKHRRNFRFLVQVADWGGFEWQNDEHVDSAWVSIKVTDVNDNPPLIDPPMHRLSLSEDTVTPFVVASYTAIDKDESSSGKMTFAVDPTSDPDGLFTVDGAGSVILVGELDRERSSSHNIRVLVTDDEEPPRTSTALLQLEVTDVNDNVPFLLLTSEVHLPENSPPSALTNISLDDLDDWSLGYGPPFSLSLDPSSPEYIKSSVSVDFDPEALNGRGIGTIKTLKALDREERKALLIPLLAKDNGGLTATLTLTLLITDLNDNAMAPAAKKVLALTCEYCSAEVPLGKVHVRDPDDFDSSSKLYSWGTPPHPQFILDPNGGELTMKARISSGSYDLEFLVTDASHHQLDVQANISVEVKTISADELLAATPVDLDVSPEVLLSHSKDKKCLLDDVIRLLNEWLFTENAGIGQEDDDEGRKIRISSVTSPAKHGGTRLWLSWSSPTPLDHFLTYHIKKVESNIGIKIFRIGTSACSEQESHCIRGCANEVTLDNSYSLIDTNATSLVGPHLKVETKCLGDTESVSHPFRVELLRKKAAESCPPNHCLNGGRCLPREGKERCICPSETTGKKCKINSRTFDGAGSPLSRTLSSKSSSGTFTEGSWLWLHPLPSSVEFHLSLEIFTKQQDSTLLYDGPNPEDEKASQSSANIKELFSSVYKGRVIKGKSHSLRTEHVEFFSLEMNKGKPYLNVNFGSGSVELSVEKCADLSNGAWHRIDVIWKDELLELIVDLCSGVGIDRFNHLFDSPVNSSLSSIEASSCRGAVSIPKGAKMLNVPYPLQVGGLSHAPPKDFLGTSFKGCMRSLRINGELQDLGYSALSWKSTPGCPSAECNHAKNSCNKNGSCFGYSDSQQCTCPAGWRGPSCSERTVPSLFLPDSFAKLALSFTPFAYVTTLQLRFRTRKRGGQLVALSSPRTKDSLTLSLQEGNLCLVLQLYPYLPVQICLTNVNAADGEWHSALATRFGSALELQLDDGDDISMYNASLIMEGRQMLELDRQEGIFIGGFPEYVGVSVYKVHEDFSDGCIDDLRLNGHPLALSSPSNSSSWGQVTMSHNIKEGCQALNMCKNVTCQPPFRCVDSWLSYNCGCGEGMRLDNTYSCSDTDECIWEPCLHNGICRNTNGGYECSCINGYLGQHCQNQGHPSNGVSFSSALVISLALWGALLVGILLVYASVKVFHHFKAKNKRHKDVSNSTSISEIRQKPTSSPKYECSHKNYFELLQDVEDTTQALYNPHIKDVDVLSMEKKQIHLQGNQAGQIAVSQRSSNSASKYSC